nr:Clp protease N-terminal domain-containing protein [Marinicella sp. W31]MDC2875924.1 Clp protease N-terminal domain-containing protein [Marinicella sp. W31]
MARLDIRAIIERFNRGSRLAIEEAGSLCVARYHREVTIEHFLFCLLGQPGNDMRVILQENNLSPDQTKETVEEHSPDCARARPTARRRFRRSSSIFFRTPGSSHRCN